MRVETVGEGEPEVAVLAAIHGDEPSGVHAVETWLDRSPELRRPVKFVVANERALAEDVRYVDADLNRVFPGDPDAPEYERRLAAELLAELEGLTTFSLHSTQSHDEPFAVVDSVDHLAESVCPYLSIDAVVEAGEFVEGRLIGHADVVEVESGLQGSEQAAENAVSLVGEFLAAVGALPAVERRAEEVPVFRLRRLVPKRPADSYGVLVRNFERVAKDAAFATVDGEQLVAEEAFYPVLMSPYGYENEFGYAADLVGSL